MTVPEKRIAKVVVDLSLDREFDYRIPEALAEQVAVGSRVVVPFGRKESTGYVVALVDQSSLKGLKDIKSVLGARPLVDEPMLKLVRWMADYYCTPFETALRTVLPGAVRRRSSGFKQRLQVSLTLEGQAAPEDGLTARQAAVLAKLREQGPLFLSILEVEANVTAASVKGLVKKGLVLMEPADSRRDPLSNRKILRTEPLTLNTEQAVAFHEIQARVDGPAPDGSNSRIVLLYGVTGSGKTEVYLQAITYALEKGKGAIVLVPEISLTPQTVERFVGRFGPDRVAILHSHLSDGERHDEWHRIHAGAADIVIGARSAVFAPVHNLGLIVVDEEHEPSYKQDEAPRYNARDIAVMRGTMTGCAIVLGSATPCMESWYNAQTGKYRRATLLQRVDDRRMPSMRVVDMRIEAARTGHANVLSRELIEAINIRLTRAEQTILFLNRRGFSTSLVCTKCGFVANCDNCSVTYTYHRTVEELRCHICGVQKPVPKKCPGCGDPAFKYSGVGTQRVEDVVKKCFPHARIQRIDADMTTRKDAYDHILGDFRSGKTQILIGTQMIAKGLHFPNVTLVGIIYADLSLHMPDFRAGERTFQLLAQVAGRAGRGEQPGEVIVQTYTPFNAAIQAARRLDFEGFCDQEIESRKELGYPPFRHLICLTFRGESEAKTAFYAAHCSERLQEVIGKLSTISDASPAPLARMQGQFRHQVMIRTQSVKAIATGLRQAILHLKLPDEVACSIDVDALSLL